MHKKLKIVVTTEEDKTVLVDLDQLMKVTHDGSSQFMVNNIQNPIQIRDDGEFEGAGFYLNNTFDWSIGIDSHGLLVAVPTKKARKER